MEPDEYGLISNDNEQVIQEDRLLVGGRYWVGLGKGILTFPRAEQAIMFGENALGKTPDKPARFGNLGLRTKEGLLVFMELAVHYRLTTVSDHRAKARQLTIIYETFGKKWADFLGAVIEAGAKDVASKRSFEEFYKQRETIEKEIMTRVSPEFYQNNFQLTTVCIINLGFPSKLEEAIQGTENARQEVEMYSKMQIREEILRDTKISLAQKTKQMRINEAKSIKNATDIQKTGELNSLSYIWGRYCLVLDELQAAKGSLSIQDAAVRYMWLKVLERHGKQDFMQVDLPADFQ